MLSTRVAVLAAEASLSSVLEMCSQVRRLRLGAGVEGRGTCAGWKTAWVAAEEDLWSSSQSASAATTQA